MLKFGSLRKAAAVVLVSEHLLSVCRRDISTIPLRASVGTFYSDLRRRSIYLTPIASSSVMVR